MSLQKLFSTIYALREQTHELQAKASMNDDSFTRSLSELTEQMYLKACDTARILIDDIEDDAIRLALRLHYINGICWYETALLTSDAKIRQKCHKYIKEDLLTKVKPKNKKSRDFLKAPYRDGEKTTANFAICAGRRDLGKSISKNHSLRS